MAKYYLSNKAVDDLDGIWNNTVVSWSENQADKYYDLLLNSCSELAKNPKLGKEYNLLIKGVLGYTSGEHIIFYRVVSFDEIEIVRILHRMMDFKSKI